MYMTTLPILLLSLSVKILADVAPFHDNAKYNSAGYGKYVTQTFQSNPQVASVPILNFIRPFTNCDDGSHLFITPRGNEADPTPMILDVTGSLIWAAEQQYGEVYNLQVQDYRGEKYLTFWAGNDAVGGHGDGEYFMLDQHYHERYRFRAANGLASDLHAFTITRENTALITIYQDVVVDFSPVAEAGEEGWIWDAIVQEIDIETGEAIFEWHASDHIAITNSYAVRPEDDVWDVYHINSVEKDERGNYLVSARFLRAIVYIDGQTGKVLWQLGGKANSFRDLSRGAATAFLGQHDAHWHDGHRFITFFDNRADWYHHMDDLSWGTRVEVDLEQMTARLDQTFSDSSTKVLSESQGSYQTLPNGHVVIGYGFNAVVGEFSPDGELLCEAYFQPSSTFGSGDVQSYRNLRFNWTGYPDTKPKLVLDGRTMYMSWNGATEIATWLILGSDTDDREPEHRIDHDRYVGDAILVDKAGFETELEISNEDGLARFVRVIALDRSGLPLGASEIVDIGVLAAAQETEYDELFDDDVLAGDDDLVEDIEDLWLLTIFGTCVILSALFILGLVVGGKKIGEVWSSARPSQIVSGRSMRQLGTHMQSVWSKSSSFGRKGGAEDMSATRGLLSYDDEELGHPYSVADRHG